MESVFRSNAESAFESFYFAVTNFVEPASSVVPAADYIHRVLYIMDSLLPILSSSPHDTTRLNTSLLGFLNSLMKIPDSSKALILDVFRFAKKALEQLSKSPSLSILFFIARLSHYLLSNFEEIKDQCFSLMLMFLSSFSISKTDASKIVALSEALLKKKALTTGQAGRIRAAAGEESAPNSTILRNDEKEKLAFIDAHLLNRRPDIKLPSQKVEQKKSSDIRSYLKPNNLEINGYAKLSTTIRPLAESPPYSKEPSKSKELLIPSERFQSSQRDISRMYESSEKRQSSTVARVHGPTVSSASLSKPDVGGKTVDPEVEKWMKIAEQTLKRPASQSFSIPPPKAAKTTSILQQLKAETRMQMDSFSSESKRPPVKPSSYVPRPETNQSEKDSPEKPKRSTIMIDVASTSKGRIGKPISSGRMNLGKKLLDVQKYCDEILSWDYSKLSTVKPRADSLMNIPDAFESYEDYVHTFEPLHMIESWSQYLKAKEENTNREEIQGILKEVLMINDMNGM